jgi:predicted HicB family RNase H-like nuclease
MNLMQYKGYYGSIEVSIDDGCLFGKLEFVEALINFEGDTIQELETAFKMTVDDYLADCEESGVEPIKPYKGSFNVRIGQDLHRAVALAAKQRDMNLNELVKHAIEHELSR